MAILSTLWIYGIYYDHSVHFMFILYIFSSFGITHQEKSGNPVWLLNWSGWACILEADFQIDVKFSNSLYFFSISQLIDLKWI
jgi:hypothetical protein